MSYRHRVTFKHDTSDDGDEDPTYANKLVNIPCHINQVSGGERYRGKQLQAETTIVIETRFNADIKPNTIAVNEVTKVEYLINRVVDNDGRRRHLIIEGVEVL